MAKSIPMWWMCGSRCPPSKQPEPEPEPLPELPPESPQKPPAGADTQLRDAISSLTDRIRHTEPETMLLLALLWILWQEHADRKLLLALAYIIL